MKHVCKTKLTFWQFQFSTKIKFLTLFLENIALNEWKRKKLYFLSFLLFVVSHTEFLLIKIIFGLQKLIFINKSKDFRFLWTNKPCKSEAAFVNESGILVKKNWQYSGVQTYLSIRVNHHDILQPNVLIAIWQLCE